MTDVFLHKLKARAFEQLQAKGEQKPTLKKTPKTPKRKGRPANDGPRRAFVGKRITYRDLTLTVEHAKGMLEKGFSPEDVGAWYNHHPNDVILIASGSRPRGKVYWNAEGRK